MICTNAVELCSFPQKTLHATKAIYVIQIHLTMEVSFLWLLKQHTTPFELVYTAHGPFASVPSMHTHSKSLATKDHSYSHFPSASCSVWMDGRRKLSWHLYQPLASVSATAILEPFRSHQSKTQGSWLMRTQFVFRWQYVMVCFVSLTAGLQLLAVNSPTHGHFMIA